jgi:hypothetical protein
MESTPFKLRFYLKYTIHESRAAVKLCTKQPIIIPEIWLDKPRKCSIIEANQDKFLKIKKYYKRRQYYGTERQQDREKPVGGFRW